MRLIIQNKELLSKLLATVGLAAAVLLAGCATKQSPSACDALDPELYVETQDPFESYNRSMFEFNLEFDRALVAPTARLYREHTSDSLQRGVSNFFNNLKEPRNFVAATMMGNVEGMANASVRFGLNSTIGLAGFIDVGQAAGMEYTDYDFGQALGYWGVGSGPYIVVPIFGPSSPRAMTGSLVHNRHTYIVPRIKKSEEQLFVQNMQWMDTRARLFPFTDLSEEQPDPYIFARESYQQTRLNKVCSP